MLFKLIETSSIPEKKKTSGDFTRLKRLHNLYRNGQLQIDKDGLTTILGNDSMGNELKAISVPYNFFPGLVNSLHIKLQHPSKAQMLRLISRYFYCSGQARIINEVVSNCELCRSLQELPKELFSESTEETPIFGRNYSADILKKDGQLIFLCREKLTQYTVSKIIPDETADSLRDAIVASVIEFMPENGAIIQVDCAPGLQTLAKESKMDGSILKRLGITIDMGRTLNINKNPIAENCVKEFHKERLRLDIPNGKISEISRSIITRNMNSRVRERGFTPKEMALNRDQMDNHLKPVSDQQLAEDQMKKRTLKHNKPTYSEDPDIQIGDDVLVKNDESKYRGRERYKVVRLFDRNHERWAAVQKMNDKFMSREYEVKLSEIFLASKRSVISKEASHRENSTHNTLLETTIEDNTGPRIKRKAAHKALEKILETNTPAATHNDALVRKTKLKDAPTHAWSHDEWVMLCEAEDCSTSTSQLSDDHQSGENYTPVDSFALPPTPNLNSVLRFNIAQLRDRAHTSSALLQKFPPCDEPEAEWDHSPEFLISDGHYTWEDSNCADDNLDWALQPRALFQATDSPTESVTSSPSDDSTFFNDDRQSWNTCTPIYRSDHTRKPFRRRRIRTIRTADYTEGLDTAEHEEVDSEEIIQINNLAHIEIQLEEMERHDFKKNPPLNPREDDDILEEKLSADTNGENEHQTRPRRSCRKQIDYKHLHNHGHQ